MKFIAPEVEIKMFNVNDILTASSPASEEPETTVSAFETFMEGNCAGNSSDFDLPACL